MLRSGGDPNERNEVPARVEMLNEAFDWLIDSAEVAQRAWQKEQATSRFPQIQAAFGHDDPIRNARTDYRS